MSQKKVIIIGAGPGGLTAAMILARRGFRVTVFEAEDTVGGRNASMHVGPYTFDVGPTFLMLKRALDEAFEDAGAVTDDLLDMKIIEPMYRLQFADLSDTNNWMNAGAFITGDGGEQLLFDPQGHSTQKMYRIIENP